MNTKPSLDAQIRKWLTVQGYPFELAVGRQFRAAGWTVGHSRNFRDVVTSKSREIDILASKASGDPINGTSYGIALAIECKRSRQKPWVIFSAPKGPADDLFPGMQLIGPLASTVLSNLGPNALTGPRLELINNLSRYGHTLVRANFGSKNERGPNMAYAAARAAIGAATAIARSNESFAYKFPNSSFLQFVFPIVVVDAPLFELFMDDDGTEQLKGTQWAQIIAPQILAHQRTCVVNIVAADSVPSFIAAAERDLSLLDAQCRMVAPVLVRLIDEARRSAESSPPVG